MSDLFIALLIVSLFGSGLVLKMLTSRLDRQRTDINIIEGQVNELAKAVVALKEKSVYLHRQMEYTGKVYEQEVLSELEVFDRRLQAMGRAAGLDDQAHDTKMLNSRRQLLHRLQENLAKLELQRAEYGLHAPIELENEIEAHEHDIEKLQGDMARDPGPDND